MLKKLTIDGFDPSYTISMRIELYSRLRSCCMMKIITEEEHNKCMDMLNAKDREMRALAEVLIGEYYKRLIIKSYGKVNYRRDIHKHN